MLFHTWTFAIFFAITYVVYLLVRKTRLCIYWFFIVSHFFYGWCNPLYVILLVYSEAIVWLTGILIGKYPDKKKIWITISVINNILLLGFFKYADFVTSNLNVLFAHYGIQIVIPPTGWLLPVGISFYTFQSMSYTIDVYRGDVRIEKNFFRLAAYISLFPMIMAGPIERARNILPQLQDKALRTNELKIGNITDGLGLFIIGLFKKVALADFLSVYVDKVYSNPANFDGLSTILATYAFAWQIFFDFSGYTDMARGIARILGINLMKNFDHPYLADGLGDFWKRWHISLSSWFKDYVYIPLGGNRKGKIATYKNMCLTMIISGVWHGANWTFLIWGTLHAIGRIFTRELELRPFYAKVPKIIKQVFVFNFVCFAWVFFKASNFTDALLILKNIFSKTTVSNPMFPVAGILFMIATWLYQYLSESRLKYIYRWLPLRIAIMFFMVFYILFFCRSGTQAFIYFQF